jgi:Acyl-coenzyme A:6-aminopenicillanic acid acyl-transferase
MLRQALPVMSRLITNPLLEIRLKGTQAQMGHQYGEIMASQGGYQEMLDFYPRMPQSLILSGLPRGSRKGPLRNVASGLMQWAVNALSKNRHEEYHGRSLAMLRAANLSPEVGKHMLVMDVFQNSIGVLGRLGALHMNDKALLHALPACSSAVVWGSMSADGELMHARNFDFPGVGIWDKSPTIVYCTPDKGIPYAYIGARGADVPGITAFNAEGLAVTFHTRFHKDVDFNATGVIDLGHDIIRNSRTIADAIEIVAGSKIASTWGIMVTSAKEKNAAVIETTAKKCRVTWGEHDRHGQTNHYLHRDLQDGEIATGDAWTPYTVDRLRLMDQFFRNAGERGGATLTDMQNLLGCDYEAEMPGKSRMMGSLIGHVMSVQSVVFKLQSGIVSVSVGEAPTGWGPYLNHNIDWSGDALKVVDLKREKLSPLTAEYAQGDGAAAYAHFQRGYLMDFEGAPLTDVVKEMQLASQKAPEDPSLHFILGALALENKDNAAGLEHFNAALALEESPYRKGQALLWASRAAAALGKKTEAQEFRRKLHEINHHSLGEIKRLAQKDANRLFARRDFSDIVINMAVLDAA